MGGWVNKESFSDYAVVYPSTNLIHLETKLAKSSQQNL